MRSIVRTGRTLIYVLLLSGLGCAANPAVTSKPTQRQVAPLPNGIYAVFAIASSAEEAAREAPGKRILYDDYRFLERKDKEPPRYLAVSTEHFVPFHLVEDPEIGTGPKGRPMLGIALDPKHSALLELEASCNGCSSLLAA